jgi:capsular polysaccharide biosynthesis protein
MVGGALLGLILGVLIVAGLAAVDDRVASGLDIEDSYPLLTQVPRFS